MQVDLEQLNFDESVLDIVGLTAYTRRTLPLWLRERLLRYWDSQGDAGLPDEELVAKYVAPWGTPWLMAWGRALLDEKEVLVCESDGLFEPMTLADALECGLQSIDPAVEYGNYTFCLVKTRIQRRSSDDLFEQTRHRRQAAFIRVH
jgi:hypothetical protein